MMDYVLIDLLLIFMGFLLFCIIFMYPPKAKSGELL